MLLNGAVVLVTGAAKRLGRSIATRLAQEGARVAIHYHTSEEDAWKTADQCGSDLVLRANLENVAEIAGMFHDLEARVGRLDGLVNNAGRFTRVHPLDVTEADWDYVHAVNLKAVFFCCKYAARIMFAHKTGRIVNISSLGGIRPWTEHSHYCASKAGVIMLTQVLAKAFAPSISVNSVAPGVVRFGLPNEIDTPNIRATPARRAGRPEEVADAVAYLLCASRFITGQLLVIDGGLSQV